jgi:hypothetical protein
MAANQRRLRFDKLYGKGENRNPESRDGFLAQTVNGTALTVGTGWNKATPGPSWPQVEPGGAWQAGRSTRTGE